MILPRPFFGGILALMVFGPMESAPADPLSDLSASIRKEFPEVSTISPAELAAWLDDSQHHPPILLDVREEREYVVSHLPGARRAGNDPAAQLRQLGATLESPIVVYCSVGYRSALLARELSKAGFSHVRNLEGSIFAWSNEDRPLVNSQGPTHGVHPFNSNWGRYLEKSKWRWKPEKSALP